MKRYVARFPFEYCALRFLLQWQSSERDLHAAFKSDPTEDVLRKALRYFQVARTFKGLKEAGRATTILESLRNIRARSLSAHEKVEALAHEFQITFGKFNVSAASKLLWLSERDPFIIYDNRAVNALSRKLGRGFTIGKYSEYCNAWREQYSIAETAIRAAVERLPKVRIFMPTWQLSDQELLQMAKQAWFVERVFDIFLWEVGGDG